MSRFRLAGILLLGLALVGFAQAEEGGLPGAMLMYGPGPRSLAMGKAFTAVADDAQAGYFNPGGLFQLNGQEVLLAHSQLFGARMEFVGYALPTREYGTFGITLLNWGAEGLDSRTERNEPYENFWAMENAFIASYCYSPMNRLGFGANLKLVTKNIAQMSDIGFGIDAGALLRWPGPFSFGITAQNLLAPTLLLNRTPEDFPRVLRAGAAARLLDDRVTVTADVTMPMLWDRDESGNPVREFTPSLTPHGGIEFDLVPGILVPRIGIDPNDVSAGLGLHRSWGKAGIGVDYAVLLHHASNYRLAPTHKVGLFVDFAGFRVWIDAQPAVFSPTPDNAQNVLWMDVRVQSRRPVKRWQILIRNGYGEIVRTFQGWEAPPLRLSWDGLDDVGRLVADGRYDYEILVIDQRNSPLDYSGLLTEVRTRGPQGRIEIRPGE